MKKIIIKEKVIDIPYAPGIPGFPGTPGHPEYWVNGEEIVYEDPEDDEVWSYIPAWEGIADIPDVPEQPEVSHEEPIGAFLATDEELEERLTKIPEGTIYEVADITAEYEKTKRISDNEALGAADEARCLRALRYIGGFNRMRDLSFEQITEMQMMFANTQEALRSNRPDWAVMFISSIEVDGTIVTSEMKEDCLDILEGRA